MRRLSSSFNKDNITNEEVDEVYDGTLCPNMEIPLESRDHGERVLYVGITSYRETLVEIGIEEQYGELVVFHAREATNKSIKEYEKQTHRRFK
jgi:hypothetical protein